MGNLDQMRLETFVDVPSSASISASRGLDRRKFVVNVIMTNDPLVHRQSTS